MLEYTSYYNLKNNLTKHSICPDYEGEHTWEIIKMQLFTTEFLGKKFDSLNLIIKKLKFYYTGTIKVDSSIIDNNPRLFSWCDYYKIELKNCLNYNVIVVLRIQKGMIDIIEFYKWFYTENESWEKIAKGI